MCEFLYFQALNLQHVWNGTEQNGTEQNRTVQNIIQYNTIVQLEGRFKDHLVMPYHFRANHKLKYIIAGIFQCLLNRHQLPC